MESNRIKILLEKYWSCEATLEEEQELKDWFRSQGSPGSPDGFPEEQVLFHYYDEAKNIEAGDEVIDRSMLQSFEDEVVADNKDLKPTKKVIRFPNLGVYGKIAAGIVIALAATLMTLRPDLISQDEQPAPNAALIKDTFDNPEEAYAETLKALQLISQKMNMGRKQTSKISIYNEAEETVKEEIVN